MRARILLIEDNPVTRRLVRFALEKGGYEVLEAGTGKAALDALDIVSPDLVLQDLVLPDIDGFDLASRLRERLTSPRVPLLAFSALISQVDEARMAAIGFDDIIVKPIQPSHLVRVIEAYLPDFDAPRDCFGAGRTVIVADDDPLQRKLATFRLRHLGFQVVDAANGREALELARASRPAAIVSDILMPEVDGFHLCVESRRDDALRHLPIILMTSSYVESADHELAAQAGADACVLRTPDFAEVITALRGALEKPMALSPEPLMREEDFEREHSQRVIRQLEKQVAINSGVAQRCALLSSELSVLSSISAALLAGTNIDGAVDDILASFFDAADASAGALLLFTGGKVSTRSYGHAVKWEGDLAGFFGDLDELCNMLKAGVPVTMGMDSAHLEQASRAIGARCAVVLPVSNGERLLGALLLAFDRQVVVGESRMILASGVAIQIARAIALATAFDAGRLIGDLQLFDEMPQLGWTARPDGYIDFYNRRWYEYTGTTYAEMQGWGWQRVHDPVLLPGLMQRWRDCIATRQPYEETFPIRGKDGVFRWFLTRVTPIFDSAGTLARWVGINTDVDDQRRAQIALLEAQQRLGLVIEGAPMGMTMTDEQGRIMLVNAHLETMFGYKREELVGQPIETLMPKRFQSSHAMRKGGFFKHPSARAMGGAQEIFGRRKDGSEVPIEVGLNPVQTPDGDFVLASVVDITERKYADAEREMLLAQLRTLNLELEERVRDRTSALSVTLKEREVLLQEIHHRVKNNLQIISSLINMQVRRVADEPTRDALTECKARVETIALIHEQLYQSANYASIPFAHYVRTLATNIFDVMGVSSTAINLSMDIEDLSFAVDRAIPCGLILNELISNALKHAFPDGRKGSIRMSLRSATAGEVTLSVADDGIGLISPIDPTKSDSLGMQLIGILVEQIDGHLEVTRSGGTKFDVTFPMEASRSLAFV